tara:strand:- start:1418 stop:3070 length:1653 start_codon:yes stop_codon:yes gene_type:complete
MLLETLGIGAILPVLSSLTKSPEVSENFILDVIRDAFNVQTDKSLILMMLFGLFCIYLLKSLFLLFLTFYQAKYIFGIQEKLSYQFFKGYLSENYEFHLSRNSSDLIRNSLSEVTQFTGAISNTLSIFSESLVLLGITVLLLIVEPLATLIVIAAMVLLGSIYLFFTKGKSERWGNERMYHDGKRIQHLQQGLSGIKEVKISGREQNFLEIYSTHNSGSANNNRKQSIIVGLPRIFIEFAAISGIVLFIFIYTSGQKEIQQVVPLLGLFGLAAFRIMPSINRIVSSMQSVRFTLPILHSLHEELINIRENPLPSHDESDLFNLSSEIELKNISFSYQDSKTVLEGIDMIIPAGSCVGLIGESGAGKSTLLDLLLGLNQPSSGEILIDGKRLGDNLRSWQKGIGYVPQDVFLTDDTLKRNIAFGLEEEDIDNEKIASAIKLAKLDSFVEGLPKKENTTVGERGVRISGGQKQRIGIARALYENPSVLVLDEATSSLDSSTEIEVMSSIKELIGTKTIIIVAHRISTMADSDFLYKIEEGKIGKKLFYQDIV